MSLAFRCGLPHYDHLMPMLSASQYQDILAFHKKTNLSIDRDDAFITQLLSMYYNVHKPEQEFARKPDEFVPWRDDDDVEYTPEQLRRKLGFG